MYKSKSITEARKGSEQVVLVTRIMRILDQQGDVWEVELIGVQDLGGGRVVKGSSMT